MWPLASAALKVELLVHASVIAVAFVAIARASAVATWHVLVITSGGAAAAVQAAAGCLVLGVCALATAKEGSLTREPF